MNLPIFRRVWVLNAAEWLALGLFLLFFLLASMALFVGRSGAAPPFFRSLLDVFFWIAWLAFLAWRLPPPSGTWGWMRGLMPFLALSFQYDLMGSLVPVVHPSTHDASLSNLSDLSGGPSAAFWASLHRPWTADLFSIFYLFLFLWLIGLMVFLLRVRRPLYARFLTGLMMVYGAGFLGYLLYPAVGPRYADPAAWAWLIGGAPTRFMEAVVSCLGARFDVFPSLHAALSAYLCAWQGRHDKRGLLWAVPTMVLIWISTLALGFHYLPDLVSGVLVAVSAVWLAPRMENAYVSFRASLEPPVLWLEEMAEGEGSRWGRLAGRFSLMLPLGGHTAPGVLFTGVSRTHGEEALRRALGDMGDGPYWMRPSDTTGSQRGALTSLKPLSVEQAVRAAFEGSKGRPFIIQQALKVTALGLTRSLPPQWMKLNEVELRLTSLPVGRVSLHRLKTEGPFGGWIEAPWDYYPDDFPVRGWELFDVVQLTRQLSKLWEQFTEVEWVLSEGRVYILDGRPVKMSSAGGTD